MTVAYADEKQDKSSRHSANNHTITYRSVVPTGDFFYEVALQRPLTDAEKALVKLSYDLGEEGERLYAGWDMYSLSDAMLKANQEIVEHIEEDRDSM